MPGGGLRSKVFHNLPEDRHQAFLSVPIIAKREVIGVINVQHKQSHRHRPDEVALMTTMGCQVGGAIETARLHAEITHKARQVETLSQVSATITSGRLLEEVLHLLVTMTAEMMGSAICSIMLLDQEHDELRIAATQSLSESYRRKPNLKVGQSISGRALKDRRPIAVLDVTKDPGYTYPDLARKEGLCSLLSVPMLVKNKPIGVINSYTAHEHLFAAEEIKLENIKCVMNPKGAAKAESFVDYKGGKVFFCCDNCPQKFDAAKNAVAANHRHARYRRPDDNDRALDDRGHRRKPG